MQQGLGLRVPIRKLSEKITIFRGWETMRKSPEITRKFLELGTLEKNLGKMETLVETHALWLPYVTAKSKVFYAFPGIIKQSSIMM